jgi:hypothetical protein
MARVVALLCLLLVAATPTPLPSHHPQTQKTKTADDKNHASSSPISTPSNHRRPIPTPTETRNYTYNYYYPTSPSESSPVWFQEATTFVLIIFTGGLWWTSIQQWRAIEKQARIASIALTELETPRVSIGKIDINVLSSDSPPALHRNPWFRFNFRNDGRSVAEVTSVCSMVRLWTAPKLPVDYSGVIPDTSAFFIGANSDTGEIKWGASCPLAFNSPEDFIPILEETTYIVLFGYIRYLDVFKNKWISGFAWRWYPRGNSMTLIGGREYNYTRKDD